MTKMAKAPAKRPRGRPATGQDPVMTVRIPVAVKAQFTAWAKSKGMGRSEALRMLIERALKSGKR
jgi:antitoxin component of RelBE/YafQ-DinJ toxin-antitoxin module